jgi:hypothetical protein
MDQRATVYIDHLYPDALNSPQPWLRRRRWPEHDAPWVASTGRTTAKDEEATFENVDDAIAWGRERAGLVLVRLGADIEACYSAGERAATEFIDGSGWPFPPWPPASWPNYDGPPEPGWPRFGESVE